MKTALPKILFYYSAAVSLFIAISTVLTSQTGAPVVFVTLFLPVVGYFIVEFFKHLRTGVKGNGQESDLYVKIGTPETIFLTFIFVILVGVSVKNILTQKPETEKSFSISNQPQLVIPKKSTPEPKTRRMLTIKITDGSESVNIRSSPSLYSDKVGTAGNGKAYEYTEKKGEWYEIILEEGKVGYISFKYVEETQNE